MERRDLKFKTLFASAFRLMDVIDAEAVMVLLEGHADWKRLKRLAGEAKFLVASDCPTRQ